MRPKSSRIEVAVVADQDVGGLDVAMDAPGAVDGGDRRRELTRRRAQPRLVEAALLAPNGRRRRRGPPRQSAASPPPRSAWSTDRRRTAAVEPHPAVEVLPGDELHGEEPLAALAHELAEADQVRMLHVGERAELLLQAIERLAVSVGDGLDRDHRIRLVVVGLVHEAHAAAAELANDLKPRGLKLLRHCASTSTLTTPRCDCITARIMTAMCAGESRNR